MSHKAEICPMQHKRALLYLVFSQHIDTNFFYCPILQCAAQRGGQVTTGRGKNYMSYSSFFHQNPQAA